MIPALSCSVFGARPPKVHCSGSAMRIECRLGQRAALVIMRHIRWHFHIVQPNRMASVLCWNTLGREHGRQGYGR